jgi:hypothetical protein
VGPWCSRSLPLPLKIKSLDFDDLLVRPSPLTLLRAQVALSIHTFQPPGLTQGGSLVLSQSAAALKKLNQLNWMNFY